MKKLIKVTKNDIKNGVTSITSCPIALAIKREMPEYTPCVTPCNCFLWTNNDSYTPFSLPVRAKRFINKFDSKGREAVKPFSFWLSVE